MEIKTSTKDGSTVIEISGSLDGSTADSAQEKITPLLTSGASLVLDLKGCSYISSAGLRLLLMMAKELSTRNGILVLSGVSSEIKDVMEMTGFSSFFKNFDSVSAAIEALRKES